MSYMHERTARRCDLTLCLGLRPWHAHRPSDYNWLVSISPLPRRESKTLWFHTTRPYTAKEKLANMKKNIKLNGQNSAMYFKLSSNSIFRKWSTFKGCSWRFIELVFQNLTETWISFQEWWQKWTNSTKAIEEVEHCFQAKMTKNHSNNYHQFYKPVFM